jgi:hypothetical protein
MSKHLKEHKIYVNEDLTNMNADVLALCRVKDKSNVEKAWSFEGKNYVKYASQGFATQLQFKNYRYWLNLPWPEKDETHAQELSKTQGYPTTSKQPNSSMPQTTIQTPTQYSKPGLSYAAAAK